VKVNSGDWSSRRPEPHEGGSFGAGTHAPTTRRRKPAGDVLHITHTFEWVDELPFGASCARRDEGGAIHTYLSRAVDQDVLTADLSRVCTAHMSDVYQLAEAG
jgi:hypothetical protein